MEKIIEVLEKYSRIVGPVISPEGQPRIERSLEQEGLIEFGIFSCPPINARLLLSKRPEEYILISPTGNTLEKSGQIQLLNKMFRTFYERGFTLNLRIIIGDTDEPDYLFPVIPPPPTLSAPACEQRKTLYVSSFTEWVRKIFPWSTSIDRYSEIESLYEDDLPTADLSSNQTQQDLIIEVAQMKQMFGTRGYYEGLPQPTDKELKKIVDLKFQTYGRQGLRLTEFYPNMVLIQNEFPLLLRTRMINLLIDQMGRERIPVFYPFPERL